MHATFGSESGRRQPGGRGGHPIRWLAAWTALAAALLSSGCSDVPATSPFDPETPAAQRHKASVVGRLVLPQGPERERFAEALVLLRPQIDPFGEARQAELTVADPDPGVRVRVRLPGLADPVAVRPGIGGLERRARW